MKTIMGVDESVCMALFGFNCQICPDSFFAGLMFLITFPEHPLSRIIEEHAIPETDMGEFTLKESNNDRYIFQTIKPAKLTQEELALITPYKRISTVVKQLRRLTTDSFSKAQGVKKTMNSAQDACILFQEKVGKHNAIKFLEDFSPELRD